MVCLRINNFEKNAVCLGTVIKAMAVKAKAMPRGLCLHFAVIVRV